MTQEERRFFDVLSRFSVGMLNTCLPSGGVHSRPMMIGKVSDGGKVRLISARAAQKVEEIKDNSAVSLSCQSEKGSYLTLSGTARLRDDHTELESIWNGAFDAWFPNGTVDAVLIELEPSIGEYWDTSGETMESYKLELDRAKASGRKPDFNDQQHHGTVEL